MKVKNVRTEFVRKGNNVTCILNYNLEFVNDLERITYLGLNEIYPIKSLKAIGRAKCSPLDTFDEVLGRRVALRKATIKMFKNITVLTSKVLKYIRNCNCEINSNFVKYSKALDKELNETLDDLKSK